MSEDEGRDRSAVLPEGWEWKTLGELGQYHNGRGFKKSEWSDRGRPIIRIQNLTNPSKPFNFFEGAADQRHVAHRGDILVSWAATLEAFVWEGDEAVVNQHIFKVDSWINPKLHFWLIKAALADLRAQAHGTGMVHITRDRFLGTRVAVPPPDAQASMVEHIERQFAAVADARRSIRRLRTLAEAWSLSAYELPFRSQRDEITKGHTEWVQIAELGKEGGLFTDGDWILSEDLKSGPDVRLLQLADIGVTHFSDKSSKFISRQRFDEIGCTEVLPGDLLISRMAHPLARCCIVPATGQTLITAVDVAILRTPAGRADQRYVMYALNAPSVRIQAEAYASGTTRKRISRKKLGLIKLPLPSLERQRGIVEQIEVRVAAVRTLEQTLDLVLSQADRLQRALLRSSLSRPCDADARAEETRRSPAQVYS